MGDYGVTGHLSEIFVDKCKCKRVVMSSYSKCMQNISEHFINAII